MASKILKVAEHMNYNIKSLHSLTVETISSDIILTDLLDNFDELANYYSYNNAVSVIVGIMHKMGSTSISSVAFGLSKKGVRILNNVILKKLDRSRYSERGFLEMKFIIDKINTVSNGN